MADYRVRLPARVAVHRTPSGNTARQRLAPPIEAALEPDGRSWFAVDSSGHRYRIRQRGHTPPGESGLELPRVQLDALPDSYVQSEARWSGNGHPSDPNDVREALKGLFTLRTEDAENGHQGLRLPQAGALHAVLAHWSTGTTEPATVVLPTGTGKTETMVALLASERLERVLVLVPSDRLRTQIAEAFETYGVLPGVGVLEEPPLQLVVGRIEHGFADVAEMRAFVERCNVLVATPDALRPSGDHVIRNLIALCSHLFVDEAHHVSAAGWARIRDGFVGKPVVQFTATPYREDGLRLGGRVIYSFPLSRAQALGYFQPISYVSVLALADPDRAVATAAVRQLRADREKGLDHLIMARVNRIGRARDDVLPLYEELAPEFVPQVLHSDLRPRERREALDAILKRRSRIVVCVDMLGEGFDFPELKIAALHDAHKSLGVTLQFIGRFARSRPDLGTATAVVARPDPGYDERLRALYAEDSQWNAVIKTLADDAIEEVRELDDFEGGFVTDDDDALSVHILRPKMSAVVYETSCVNWHPERLSDFFSAEQIVSAPAINAKERVAWVVAETRSSIRWAHLQSLEDVAYHLHVLYWDKPRGLLYINTSQLESLHEDLARAVCGTDVRRVQGDVVYRALGELQRPTPTNVGVIDLRNRSRRFSMHVGADVYEGFPVAEQQTKSNTNIFVVAYENGERVTMGAARKGRVWSQQAADSILEWVRWCSRIGPKLQDPAISIEALFRSFVRPEPLRARPKLMPLAIDWPWLAYAEMSDSVALRIGNTTGLLIDAELALTDHAEEGPIRFEVRLDDVSAPYEAVVADDALAVRPLAEEAHVIRPRSDPEPLGPFLSREGATIWFEHEVVIEGSVLYRMQRDEPPIDLAQLVPLSWDGVDIRKESQGPERDAATVQARASERLCSFTDWDLVLDDDGSGETADLVALKEEGDRLVVHLVHCKYSSKGQAGARVADLYEVCGQAHRSAHHRHHVDKMVRNLIRRERRRLRDGRSGLLVGDEQRLLAFQDVVRKRRPELRVTVVQPGLSKARAEANQLRLLGATDVYVAEVASGRFDVWCSE